MPVRRRRKSRKGLFLVAIIIVAFVFGIGYIIIAFDPCRGFPFPTIDGEQPVVHSHALLKVFINGNEISVPNDIGDGDSGGCRQPLHTHADSPGIIHVEPIVIKNYTVDDFFKVWAGTRNLPGLHPVVFTHTNLFNYTAGSGFQIRMYVNGNESSQLGSLVLKERMTIVIAYDRIDSNRWETYRQASAQPWPSRYSNL